jgi:uroporphyrinogen-III synthase
MKLLVTRPADDAAALALLLEGQGHEVVIDPMLEIRRLDADLPPLDDVEALLFTSTNGVRAFAAVSPRRDLAVYAVGDRTAEAARQAGFGEVESADGDVEALARLVASDRKPEDGALLHVSGAVRAGNLAETLAARGFTVRHAALYEAVAASSLGAATQAAIRAGTLDGVLLFSPRTAELFAKLVEAAGLADRIRRVQAWCLSRAVAEALAPLRLVGIHIAAEPTQASLLKAVGIRKVLDTTAEPAAIALGAAQGSRPALSPSVARGRRSLAAVAALVLLVIALTATAPQWLPLIEPLWRSAARPVAETPPPPSVAPTAPGESGAVPAAAPPAPSEIAAEPDTGTGALSQRLDRLEAALDGVRVNAASAAPKGTVTTLQGQMAELSRQLDTLAQRPAADPTALRELTLEVERLAAAMVELSDRLTPVETRVGLKAASIRNDRTLVLAAGEIRAALAGSGPFDAPVAVIRAVAPEDADFAGPLGVLESHAEAGVASRVRLAQMLADLPGLLAEPAPLAPDAGIWDRVADKMSRLVTIRRVDDGRGTAARPADPDRLVAEAEQALAGGDLAGAANLIQSLSGAEADAAKPWLEAARARLDCEEAALALETQAIRRLSAPPEAGAAE